MIDLYRHQLAAVRKAGIDVFVIPGPPLGSAGQAYCAPVAGSDPESVTRHINIMGSVHSPLWLYILLHEVAHHELGHTQTYSSTPAWVDEYEADLWALERIKVLQPYAYRRCEQAAKKNVRWHLQGMINAGSVYHVDLEVADWAGCNVPVSLRAECIEWREAINHPFDPDSIAAETYWDGELDF